MIAPTASPGIAAGPPAAVPSAPALRLAWAGLVPLVGGAAMVWIVHPGARPYAVQALAAYAALVASFLGGIHWGVAMLRPDLGARAWGWGVVPCLVAWPALVMRPEAGLVVLGVLIAACYLVDRRRYPVYGLAGWLTLRFRLSMIAALACFLGAAGA